MDQRFDCAEFFSVAFIINIPIKYASNPIKQAPINHEIALSVLECVVACAIKTRDDDLMLIHSCTLIYIFFDRTL